MPNFKFIKCVSIFFVLAFVLFSHHVSLAKERVADTKTLTKIEIKDVKIEKSDTEIKIIATLFNPSANIETSPFTTLILLENNSSLIKTKNEDAVAPFIIVSAKEGDSFFSLKPQESKEANSSLSISRYAPYSNYRFSLQAINQYGEVLGRYNRALKGIGANQASQVKYKNGFLVFDYNNCKIVNTGGKEFDLNEGPIFNPSQQPLVRCAITNIGNETITAYPFVEWKEYLVYGRPSDTAKKIEKYPTPIIFEANEMKKVEILLPKAEKPQVYQALLSFADSDGAVRSFALSLRWTIGGSSARVDNVSLISPLKNIYEKGETVSLSADYFGSMDLYWNRGDNKMASQKSVRLSAIIKNSQGEECGKTVKKLPDISDGSRKNEIIDIVLEKKCEGIAYGVSFLSQEEVLSNASGKLPKVIEENKAVNYKEIGIISFFILAFLALLFIQIKKKGVAKISLFCLLLGVSLFFANSASANDYGGVAGYNGDWGGVSTDFSDVFYLGHGRDKPAENYSTFRVRDSQGLGYGVGINFSDLGNPEMDVVYKVGDNGCGNVHSVYFRVSVKSEADGVQKDVHIRDFLTDNEQWNKYNIKYMVSQTEASFQTLSIDPSVMNDFYYYDSVTGNYKQRSNPKLIVTIRTAVERDETGRTQFRRGAWGAVDGTVYSSVESALDASVKAVYTIPLNLPAPSADLSLASISGTSPIDYNCKPALSWTVNDVSSCSANGGWSGSLDASNGTHSKTLLTGITNSTTYGLSCSKNLGSAIGTGTYSDSVTVGVKDAPTVDLKAKKWGDSTAPTADSFSDSLTINSGDSVTFHWGLGNWSYGSAGVQSCEFENVTYTTGTQKTLSNITNSKTYNITCKNSCGYSVTDNVKITCANCSSATPIGGTLTQPQNFTASAACQAVNLQWDKDKNGEYDSITNNSSKVVKYYEITRDGSYTIKKSDNINRNGWSNNSYTDSSATDSAKSYSYTIKACNDQDKCSADVGPATATPSSGPCTGNLSSTPSSIPASGACGAAINTSWSSEPTNSLLCSAGTPSTVGGGSGSPWTWTCAGSSSTASCSANYNYNPAVVNLTLKTIGSGTGNVKLYGWRATPLFSYDWNDYGELNDNDFQDGETHGVGKDWWYKMTATPDSGSYFSGWSGCSSSDPKGTTPSSSENACFVTMSGNKSATVTFNSNSGGGGGSSVKAYISARDTVVTDGNSTAVVWTSDNATSCEQKEGGNDTGWISASDTTSGSYTTDNFTTSGGSRTYKITCVNGSQTADAETTVSVGSDYTGSPSVTMWADPQSVGYKKTAKIKWMASNIMANQCYVLYSPTDSMNGYMKWYTYASLPFGNGYYASGIGANNTTGQTTGKLTSDTTYKIQCKGYGPSYTKVNAQTTIAATKPVSNFTIANSSGTALVANIVEGLSANSGSIDLTLSGEAIGNISLSASISAISGAKAQFSSDNGITWSDTLSVDISATSQVKIKVIKIPGATPAGTYNVAVTAADTGSGGKTKKLKIDLQVNRVSSDWEEF